ncbi:MAG: TIGR02147 family protein [Oligoflexales bacterium]
MVTKSDIEETHHTVYAASYMDYRIFIQDFHRVLKKSVKKMSWLDFTELCGLGRNNTVYQVVISARPLSFKNAKKLADSLNMKGNNRKYFLQLVVYQHAKSSAEREEALSRLLDLKSRCLSAHWDKKNLNIFSEWYHLTILELLRLDGVKDEPEWIASVLKPRVPVSKVQASLELLESLQWISYDEEKLRLYPTRDRFSTGREIRGMAVQSYHQTMIHLASQSLSQEKPSLRDITSVTVSVPKGSMKDLKDLTAEFRQKVMEYADRCDHSDDIVQVNIQLFPLTHTDIVSGGDE